MQRERERVIVIGAGPVGLCLALSLAQEDIRVVVVETLGANNFLEQVPRAGTNHPATLELYDRIGLYARIEPRGIIAPLVHYWDRHERKLIAEFDHRHLKDDTRFPYVLQCERQTKPHRSGADDDHTVGGVVHLRIMERATNSVRSLGEHTEPASRMCALNSSRPPRPSPRRPSRYG